MLSCSFNALYKINEHLILIGGKWAFTILNIDKCLIEKEINDISFGFGYCLLSLEITMQFYADVKKGIFCFYDMKTKQYKITKNNHKDRYLIFY